jgi:hypothetical protein
MCEAEVILLQYMEVSTTQLLGKQNLGGKLPNYSFLNELLSVQSDCTKFPRQAFSSELS